MQYVEHNITLSDVIFCSGLLTNLYYFFSSITGISKDENMNSNMHPNVNATLFKYVIATDTTRHDAFDVHAAFEHLVKKLVLFQNTE